MVTRSKKFTPQVMLSAPRRSAGVPNSVGDTVIHTSSAYSFETHKKDNVLRVVDVKTGDGHDVVRNKEVSELNWIDDETFTFTCAEKEGVTTLCVGHVPDGQASTTGAAEKEVYVAGTIDAPVGSLRITRRTSSANEDFAIVFSAEASPDGTLFNAEKATKTQSTGRLYNSLFVRHWDRYETKEKNALWYATLCENSKGRYELGEPVNVLKGTGLESPVRPFGGTDHFDVHDRTIIFVAKDPNLDPALNTKSNIYIARIQDSGPSPTLETVVVRGYEGASTSPVISPDGRKAAFLCMKANGYEADRNEIFLLWPFSAGVTGGDGSVLTAERLLSSHKDEKPEWDRSPGSIVFSADGKSLFAVAEEHASAKLFQLEARLDSSLRIRTLTNTGSVSDVRPLQNGNVFISGTSLMDNSYYSIVAPGPWNDNNDLENVEDLSIWTNSNSAHGSKFGLRASQVDYIWTPASNPSVNHRIHSIVIKPSNFDSSKKYPVAYAIHGGPQGSWADTWSTRWNLAVLAEQGYIVIAPNPTGSTGYGQAFTDAIQNNWGGDPYQDIVNCFEWVGKCLPQADNSRAVALGGSYGGYMINWIQGHDLGRKLKCLVCHDGILSMTGMLSTDEMYFLFRDLGGTPWHDSSSEDNPSRSVVENKRGAQTHRNFGASTFPDWRRWDPSEHFHKWATPELVIHSSNDFRIAIADGLATFNVLQARGVDSQFLTFPDENHWVLKPENSLAWHKVVLNWMNKYVGLPPFSAEDPESEEFWGGVRGKEEEVTEIMSQGKPEM